MSKPVRFACVLVLLLGVVQASAFASTTEPVRLGIFTDLHAHDADSPLDGFEMVDWPERLSACVDAMNVWPADLMIQLGDFVNGRFVLGGEFVGAERVPEILEEAVAVYATFNGPRHYVLGNHDVHDLTKSEFLERVGAEATTSSFDAGGYHFVLLDAQYHTDGTDCANEFWYMQGSIPPETLAWLQADLAESRLPTIVCIHQRLDVDVCDRTGVPQVANYLDARDVLESAGDVIAVFQGHDHRAEHNEIAGIHYITFSELMGRASGKPPTWAYVTLDPEARTVSIVGEGEQADYELGY